MAHSGQELTGPDGYRLLLRRIDADLLEMEASYPQERPLPPLHLHPSQTERFEVLEGTIRAVIAGEERDHHAGETFAVPAGTPHTMTATGAARMRWEVRPALRTAEFFERLYTAPPRDADEGAAFLAEFAAEVRFA